MLPIDVSHLIPRYYQIYDNLYNQIQEGKYANGEKLPSEEKLCDLYQVSRGTIREAIKLLLQQGLLNRERGKGTFVSLNKIGQDLQQLMGFTELMNRNGMTASAKILEVTVKDPNPKIKEILMIPKGEQVVKVQRLRFGDKEPLIIEKSYFVRSIFQPLLKHDLENQSIYDILYKETALRLGEATQDIEATVAGPVESKAFGIEFGSPLLLMKRIIMLKDGSPFEYSEDYYRSDKLKFTVKTLPYEENQNNLSLVFTEETDQEGGE